MITNEITIDVVALSLGCSKRNAEILAKRESLLYIEKSVRGGKKRFYALESLPSEIKAKVTLHLINTGALTPSPIKGSQENAHLTQNDQNSPTRRRKQTGYDSESLWNWYASRSQKIKDEGTRRAGFCLKVRQLLDTGLKVNPVLVEVARANNIPLATLKRWWYGETTTLGAANVDRSDYAAALAPRYAGCQEYAEMSPEAWDWIKADWLRPEQPSVAAVYRRVKSIAVERGWALPSLATTARRLEALPWQVRVLARDGEEALKRMLPHITRVKGSLHALEAVNADGHVFDVRVTLPSGEVGRPVLVAWQDIYSGKILSYRVGETLNQHIVRLAFGDLVEQYGVPGHAFLDNGREFANKWLTGGAKTRFRFTIREDDPIGIFTQLGITIHWTTPYHGQSKPIERAFRDLCEGISKHPACSGAYTGNSTTNKPSNYGERAMAWDDFIAVVTQGIAEHNARMGRRSETARGRSFDITFDESYGQSTIRKASAEQRRLWLLAAEGLTVRPSGHVAISTNLYWGEGVAALAGRKVVVRFDSDNLTNPVHVYDLAGEYLGEASCTQANFLDSQAAKDHSRANRQKVKAAKQQLDAERRMVAIEAAQHLPNVVVPMERPNAGAIAPMFERSRKVVNADYYHDDEDFRPDERNTMSLLHLLPRRDAEAD